MNGFVEDQNVLVELKKHIDLMSRQLDFLIRNEKQLTALDIDVLMSRTHQIYEIICSAPCSDEPIAEVEIKPLVENTVEQIVDKQDDVIVEQQPDVKLEYKSEPVVEVKNEPIIEEQVVEQKEIVEEQQVIEEKSVEQIVVEQPKPKKVEKSVSAKPKAISTEEQLTLADKMAQQEDESLAARLQRKPIKDLKSAIGINEKFLFVNELFGGSMEKYNKSINMLNEVPTLSGANVCLNELKIELQWSSTSESYKKLNDLVVRRFDVE